MKTYIVTGTTSGIGLTTAEELVRQGHEVILASRQVELAQQQADEMKQKYQNDNVVVIPLDLSSFHSIDTFVAEVNKKYKKIDCLINNAGLYQDTPKKTEQGFEVTVGVNFLGTYYLTKELLPILKKAEEARICNVASTVAFIGRIKLRSNYFQKHPSGIRAYSASKVMMLMMNIELANELKEEGITVNAIHPGVINTNIWKGDSWFMNTILPKMKKRYPSAEEACRTSVYVATSEQLSGVTGMFYRDETVEVKYNRLMLNGKIRRNLMKLADEEIASYKQSLEVES